MGPFAAASGFTTAALPRFLPIPCRGMRLLTRGTASCCPAPSIFTCTSTNPPAPTGKDGVQAVAPPPPAVLPLRRIMLAMVVLPTALTRLHLPTPLLQMRLLLL